MKKIYFPVLLGAVIAAFISCQKDLPTYLPFDAYEFATLDEGGGSWTPVLLSSPDQIGIPVPEDPGSPAYLAELEELKSLSANPGAGQLAAVEYWSNNPVIRWNEIARDMAAKYNLIPAPNPDGTYPAPDPANPGAYPNFPFSHPPYTCRMLAYWSAAQFDALIATWHYKYQFNRPPAFVADEGVKTHLPEHALPSYPSEGAVVAAVSKVILTAMFPLEKDFLEEKAEEHLNSLQWAGMNVESEIAAGDSLGRAVAALFLQRAATDGMKSAQAPKPVADSLRDAAQAQWGWHWENQEDPPRPVGLTPLFGKVKPWFIPNVEAVRPGPPPAPGSPEFQADVDELVEISENLTSEQRRIANFWSDGLSTYTPPGHWNRFAAEMMIKNRQNPLRSARTFAYMNMAIMDGGISCWDAKYYYHYPRPTQVIPGFKAILGVPNFPSYTSGHSTFSAAAATVLSHIYPEGKAQFEAWAEEAAVSRIYGGIHFRFDAEVGTEQGKDVGAYAVQRAMADGGE